MILIITFFTILFQDSKDRKVYWFLYPIVGLLTFFIQINESNFLISATNSMVNLAFVFIILSVCYFYAKLKFKKHFTNDVLGIGDVLFFIFISFSFASISFIVFFVFSLLFSLLLHLIFKNKNIDKTVPLAGYMSLFFGTIYMVSFFLTLTFYTHTKS
ncbi:general secretion pathway protein [Flavobacterium psychrophilum]|uniref:general secretion pathway protein n=1 Tax=Flavobacterium psychrophilum TaxID=96345 RepID=UPI002155CE29|nr:general secretion pathway protein [Flavobacterium psychrophilum]